MKALSQPLFASLRGYDRAQLGPDLFSGALNFEITESDYKTDLTGVDLMLVSLECWSVARGCSS